MKRRCSPRFIAFLFALLWAAGNVAIWFLMPYGPRDGWQPPEDEFAVGFLSDSRTLVALPRSADGKRGRLPETGPVHLWDIEHGTLRASHFGRGDQFCHIRTDEHHDWLLVSQQIDASKDLFGLRIHDAWTGQPIAQFRCRGEKHHGFRWNVTHDGQMLIAGGADSEERPRIDCYDISSGQRRCSLPGVGPSFCISADGHRLAAIRGSAMVVFDVPEGKEVFRVAIPTHPSIVDLWPAEFSPDGKLLRDTYNRIWDISAGTVKFQSPGGAQDSSLLMTDGRELAVATTSGSACSLCFFELSTGLEKGERRCALLGGVSPGMMLGPWTPDGRFLLAEGSAGAPTSPVLDSLAKVPLLNDLLKARWHGSFVVIEAATGRELVRGNSRAWCCTRDGRYVLSRSDDEVYKLWDIPARKPLRWLLPAFAIWTAAFTSLGCWLGARAGRRASHAGQTAVK